MKSIMPAPAFLLFGSFLLFSAGTLSAQEKERWAQKLFTEPITHDFGPVPRGPQLVHHFRMKNVFKEPLEINVSSNCGCLTTAASPKVLDPGQEGSIDVVMNTFKFAGSKTSDINVTVGPKFVDSVTLTVFAFCRVDVVLNPGQIDFGVVTAGQAPPPKALDIDYIGPGNWRILEVQRNGVPVKADLVQAPPKNGKPAYRLSLALNADAQPGLLNQQIILKTDDQKAPLLLVPVRANIQAPLSVTPNLLDYGRIKKGTPASPKLIMVKAGKPFRVLAVDGQSDGISADCPAREALVHIIKLNFLPAKEGLLHKQLVIKTDFDNGSQVRLALEGTVVP